MCAANFFLSLICRKLKKVKNHCCLIIVSIIGGYCGEKVSYDVISMRKMFENFGIEKNSSKSLAFVQDSEWENEE